MRARYRYTHWIGAAVVRGQVGIFDVNCTNNGSGWVSEEDWIRVVVPAIVAMYKRATGAWYITHALEIAADGPYFEPPTASAPKPTTR